MNLEIPDQDVELFQSLICRKSGMYLEGSRLDALRAGLRTRIESQGFASPGRYYSFLRFHPEGHKELEELLSYVTINETYFFRNTAHFEALRYDLFPRLINENKESAIRIWSAGCSTGEEPYSIAMTVLNLVQDYQSTVNSQQSLVNSQQSLVNSQQSLVNSQQSLVNSQQSLVNGQQSLVNGQKSLAGQDISTSQRGNLRIEILGTDVDRESLAKAERGLYRERSLRVTEDGYRNRYFKATSNGELEIDERIRDIVQFKYFNLMETPYPEPSIGKWDIIFCRNVVIYFDRSLVGHVAGNFHDVLADSGYLFMGHSETLDGISDEFSLVEMDKTFVYVKSSNNTSAIASAGGVVNSSITSQRQVPKLGSASRGSLIRAGSLSHEAGGKKKASKRRAEGRERRAESGGQREDTRHKTAGKMITLPEASSLESGVLGFESSRSYALSGKQSGHEDLGENRSVRLIEDVEPIYREVLELLEREQSGAALSKIEAYIGSRPEDAKVHLLAGKIYADRGNYEQAVDEFRKSVELDPLLTESHYLLGVIYQGLGQMNRAIDEFKKSVYIDKDCVLPYFSLACIYQSSNMRQDALREYNNAVRILEKTQGDEIIQFSGGIAARLLMQTCLKSIEELSGASDE
jgi:chemotaxis protein methyltransferase CheR